MVILGQTESDWLFGKGLSVGEDVFEAQEINERFAI